MANNTQVLRIGKVSSINYKNGTARVTYEDRGGSTTSEMPFLAWEYWMPRVSDQVLVGHLSNGSSSAVILGPVWNASHRPQAYGEGLFRKELSTTKNKAVISHDDKDGTVRIRAEHIVFDPYKDGDPLGVADLIAAINKLNTLAGTVSGLQSTAESLQGQINSLSGRIASLGG